MIFYLFFFYKTGKQCGLRCVLQRISRRCGLRRQVQMYCILNLITPQRIMTLINYCLYFLFVAVSVPALMPSAQFLLQESKRRTSCATSTSFSSELACYLLELRYSVFTLLNVKPNIKSIY